MFYVGKGKGGRAWSPSGRNQMWERVNSKHGRIVEIVEQNLQEWYAFELEKDLISLYGRRDDKYGTLVNLTDGGEGPSGVDCPKTDINTYNFYNFNTGETYTGLRIHFRDKHNLDPAPLFYKSSNRVDININGWVRYDDEIPTNLRIGFKGHLGTTADKQIYNFINSQTGEVFIGTRLDFGEKYNLDYTNMFSVGASNKGWFCIEKCDLIDMYYKSEGNRPKPNIDKTICNFENFNGDKFSGLRVDFTAKYGLDLSILLCKNPRLTMKGWFITERKDEVLASRNDLENFTFFNIHTKETISTTRRKFQDSHMDVAIHHVLDGNCTAIKGWTVIEVVDEDELRKTIEGRTGRNNHKSCTKVYDFINVYTLELLTGTRGDLKDKVGGDVSDLFRDKARVCKGWTLKTTFDTVPISVLKNKKADPKIHTFINSETNETFIGLKFDFKELYGVCPTPLFSPSRPQKSTKGWSLVKEEPISQ